MTAPVAYTLVGDGTSDRVLTAVIDWVLREALPGVLLAEPAFLHRKHQPIVEAVEFARQRFGRHLVIVHRDAERATWETRAREILTTDGVVRLIPVRMTEAWLLGDEQAIRYAAGNPEGTAPLQLPAPDRLDSLPDPKGVLRDAIIAAAGAPRGRRLKALKRELSRRARLVAEYTDTWTHLDALEAFRRFRTELLVSFPMHPPR